MKMYIPSSMVILHQCIRQLKDLLQLGVIEGIFTQNLADKRFVEFPTVPIFHSLPKDHKNVFPPPLRPIVAGIGSRRENLGTWLDHLLQPLLVNLLCFLRDTKQLVSTSSPTKKSLFTSKISTLPGLDPNKGKIQGCKN